MVEQRVDRAREFAYQAPRRCANAGCCRGADEIGYRLRLSEVDLVIEKCPLGELTGLGQARAEIEAALQDQRQDPRATVTLELQNVFAGIRRRRGKEQRDAMIERVVIRAAKRSTRRHARHQRAADDAVDDAVEVWSRHPDDAEATAPRRRRDS